MKFSQRLPTALRSVAARWWYAIGFGTALVAFRYLTKQHAWRRFHRLLQWQSNRSSNADFGALKEYVSKYRIHELSDMSEVDAVVKSIGIGTHGTVLGFDIEWKPPNGRTALMQISSQSDVLLVHLTQATSDNFSPELKKALEDANVIKAGVGVDGDAHRLRHDFGICMLGLCDLSRAAISCGYVLKKKRGLKTLARLILNMPMIDNHPVQYSDWEALPLSQQQHTYATADAVAGREVFCELYAAHANGGDVLGWASTVKAGKQKASKDTTPTAPHSAKVNSAGKTKAYRITARKTLLYHNCMLVSPDNVPMCNCETRRVMWYVDRGLAEIIQETPNIVARLTFLPAGLGRSDSPYYLSKKHNQCVVCGSNDTTKLIKFGVVPPEYRKAFPLELKSHKSHDVLLLCTSCSEKASAAYIAERYRVAAEYNAPLSGSDRRYTADYDAGRIINYARILLTLPEARRRECPLYVEYRSDEEAAPEAQERKQRKKSVTVKDNIPANRVYEMMQAVASAEETTNVTHEMLTALAQRDKRQPNADFKSHGEMVLAQLTTVAQVHQFVVRWRSVFVEQLKPRHMPEHWDVNFVEELFDVNDPKERKRGITIADWRPPDLPQMRDLTPLPT